MRYTRASPWSLTPHCCKCQGWTPPLPCFPSPPWPGPGRAAVLAQAPSATSCGMCESHVSNPQTVGKCCSLLNSPPFLLPCSTACFHSPSLPRSLPPSSFTPALSRRLPCPAPAAHRKLRGLPEARRLELRLPKNIFTPITPSRRHHHHHHHLPLPLPHPSLTPRPTQSAFSQYTWTVHQEKNRALSCSSETTRLNFWICRFFSSCTLYYFYLDSDWPEGVE